MEWLEQFLKFEDENGLFELQLQGIKIWPYIRMDLYQMILNEKIELGKTPNSTSNTYVSKWYKIKNKWDKFNDRYLKNPFLATKQKDILVVTTSRRTKNGDCYECIYTDYLLKNIPYSYNVLELSGIGGHQKPTCTKNLKYIDYIVHKQYQKKEKYQKRNLYQLTDVEKDSLIGLVNKLGEVFDIQIDFSRVLRMTQSRILNYHCVIGYLDQYLNLANPKIMLLVCYYSFYQMILIELAKKRGIKVVELQHGSLGRYHLSYNFYQKKEFEFFPEYIFLFGDAWKENTRFPFGSDHLYVTGFPYYERRIKEEVKFKKSNNKQCILFISQWTIGNQLSKMATDLALVLPADRYEIVYKLHPGEYLGWKDAYPWLKNSSVKVIDNNDNDIYYYFSHADFQVGVYSTALVEGIGFGLKTFIVKLYGHEYLNYLYEPGYAQLVHSVPEIIAALTQNGADFFGVKDYFWASNSLENMIQAITQIIER